MTNNRCTLVLVRHAQPNAAEPGGPGDYERSLTPQGLSQAEQLATEWTMPEPALIISSPYLRAIQTVEPLAPVGGPTGAHGSRSTSEVAGWRAPGRIVVVGSYGTFISRALLGFGRLVDWPFCAAMPMPAIYRLHITEDQVVATGPGLPGKVGG